MPAKDKDKESRDGESVQTKGVQRSNLTVCIGVQIVSTYTTIIPVKSDSLKLYVLFRCVQDAASVSERRDVRASSETRYADQSKALTPGRSGCKNVPGGMSAVF